MWVVVAEQVAPFIQHQLVVPQTQRIQFQSVVVLVDKVMETHQHSTD
jgi:hypothetical protein